MLSNDIAALAAGLEKYMSDGLELSPVGVALAISQLQNMADDAAILEQNSRPIMQLGGSAPVPIPDGSGNVVRLDLGR